MLQQHSVQRAARATNRSQARRPRVSPSFLAHSGDVLDQRRELARAQGALSRNRSPRPCLTDLVATVLHLMSQLNDGDNDESITNDDQADPLQLVGPTERRT